MGLTLPEIASMPAIPWPPSRSPVIQRKKCTKLAQGLSLTIKRNQAVQISSHCRFIKSPPLKRSWKEESMPKSQQNEEASDSAAPIVVSIEGAVAGLAVPECGRYRFLSAHPGFDLLDGSRFTRPEEIRIAADRL